VIETREKDVPVTLQQRPLMEIVNWFGMRGYVIVSEYTQGALGAYVSVWLSKEVPWVSGALA